MNRQSGPTTTTNVRRQGKGGGCLSPLILSLLSEWKPSTTGKWCSVIVFRVFLAATRNWVIATVCVCYGSRNKSEEPSEPEAAAAANEQQMKSQLT